MNYADTIAFSSGLTIGYIAAELWWLWLFILLSPLFVSTWVYVRQEIFKRNLNFVLLELRIPREIQQSPKAMEQVLMSIHAMRNSPGNFKEYFLDGETTVPFSLEFVSFGGEVHYFIRCRDKHRPMTEAAIFSFYPDIEVVEVEDYILRLPTNIQEMAEQDYEMWGTEMILAKSSAFPIRTYKEFEAMTEEREFDPMASILETLAKLKKEEIVAIQIIIAPAGVEWRQVGIDEVNKLKETKMTKSDTGELIKAFSMKTPGETDVIKAIENNISKPAFDTTMRIIYFSPTAMYFDGLAKNGIMGAFNQYSSLHLNAFKSNGDMVTRAGLWSWPHIFPAMRLKYKKQRLLNLFRNRRTPIAPFMGRFLTSYFYNLNYHSKSFVMNTECLATIWHPPTMRVLTAPHVKRVESRKAGPPAGLAIYAEEKELEDLM